MGLSVTFRLGSLYSSTAFVHRLRRSGSTYLKHSPVFHYHHTMDPRQHIPNPYATIQPAPPRSVDDDRPGARSMSGLPVDRLASPYSSDPSASNTPRQRAVKRQRTLVQVACESCRKKKQKVCQQFVAYVLGVYGILLLRRRQNGSIVARMITGDCRVWAQP